MVGFYGISTIVGYLMPNPLYTYILDIYDLVGFYGISTIVGYLMPNPLYTYILFGLVGFQVLLYDSNNLTSVICLHIFKWIYIYDLKG